MLIPVRCVTCGKVIADKWRAYQEATKDGDAASRKKAMDELGLVRYYCRRHFLSQVDLLERI